MNGESRKDVMENLLDSDSESDSGDRHLACLHKQAGRLAPDLASQGNMRAVIVAFGVCIKILSGEVVGFGVA